MDDVIIKRQTRRALDGSVTETTQYLPQSGDAAVALLKRFFPQQAQRLCKLASCGQPFTPPPGKGRPREYCCTEHQERAHRLAASARVKRMRAKRSAATNQKTL